MTEFYRDEHLTVLEGDCRDVMRQMPAESVHCVVTSPPYYSLRDYGIEPTVWGGDPEHEHVFGSLLPPRPGGRGNKPGDYSTSALTNPQRQDEVPRATSSGQLCECGAWLGQLGLEPHPRLFVEHLVDVFREVRRVLHPDGLVWLNLGDSFAAERGGTEMPAETMAGGVGGHGDDKAKRGRPADGGGLPHRQASRIGLKHKDLIGIPWLVAFALRDDGWWLRRDVVWSKPSPMPESAEDRPSSSHEYVFMLAKAERYFYDRVAVLEPDVAGHSSGNGFKRDSRISGNLADGSDEEWLPGGGRNRRSVWTIATRPYKGAHFATFPPALVEVPIKASTSSRGVCPECGYQWRRQTTMDLVVHHEQGRTRPAIDHGPGRGSPRSETVVGTNEFTTHGWRPGCGHGWGGDPDDLDLIASPLRRGGEVQDEATTRRGLDRARQDGEGRRIITRYEQRAYAAQLRSWDGERTLAALDAIADWLGKPLAGDEHPGMEAWRHYTRFDRRGARAIPPKLFDRWIEAGWLTPVEPPDYSGALAPVPAVVLDPFGGSGTVGMVAASLGRRAILIDVNADYLVQQMKRNAQVGLGLGL